MAKAASILASTLCMLPRRRSTAISINVAAGNANRRNILENVAPAECGYKIIFIQECTPPERRTSSVYPKDLAIFGLRLAHGDHVDQDADACLCDQVSDCVADLYANGYVRTAQIGVRDHVYDRVETP